MPKKKLKPIGKLTDEAARLMQRLVKIKAADHAGFCTCVTCGKVDYWWNMQGGHYIPRGNDATKLLEENIHPQCSGCNGFGMKYGDAEKHYTLYMIDMYGRDFVEELLATKGKPHKWYRPELEDLIKELKERIKEAEKLTITKMAV